MESTSKPMLRLVPSEEPTARTVPELDTDLIDEAQLAARLSVSRSTLQSWRYAKRGPRYIKLGRLIRYRNADIDLYLRAQTSSM
jgi:predicted DNA-binding transcriptional regulator AlpA